MLRRFLKIGAFLALMVGSAAPSWAQAVRYDNILLNQSGKPVTNGQIQVCAGNISTPVPCTPTTAVYADQALTQLITQPFSTGPLGNYGFWLPVGGTYTVSVSGKNITSLNFPITVGGSGGGGTPGGSDTQLQLNSHGNFAGSSSLTLDSSTSPTQLNLGLDLSAKGPNPWVDIRAYGARATTISTTCTGSGTALTVGTTGFINGDGIDCIGGGAAPSATTPTAPSVTPGEAETETVPNAYMTTGVSGTSTYNYTIFAEDANGGLTAASPVTTITTGPAALGETSVTLSAISLTGNTLSITSSASHGMVANVLAHVTNTTAGDSPFLSGWFTFDTIGSGTTATSNHAMVYSASTVTGAGSLVYFVGNNITWSPVTGAVHYYVCAERPGDASYHIIGQALPTTTQFVDWGSTLSANPVIPWYVSSAQCTAASAQNDLYVGTVQSGGGTTALTVSPALTSNISGTSGRFDNEPAILAAMNAVATLGKLTAVYIPSGTFAINSPLTVPSNTAVLQAGTLAANASITASGGAINWTGEIYKGSVNNPQFAEAGYPQITCNAYPCFTTYEGFSRLQFSGPDNSLLVYIHQNAWAANFDHTNFVTGGSNSDNTGIAVFTVQGVSQTSFSHSLFFGGPSQTIDQTWTPLFYQMGGNSGPCSINLNFVQWNRRGYYCQSNAGAPYLLQVRDSYRQGGITPMFAISNNSGNLGGTTILENVLGDTESQATVALTGVGGAVVPYIYLRDSNVLSVDAGGRPSNLTGNDSSGVNLVVGGEQIGGNFQGFTTANGTFTSTSPLIAPNPFVLTNGGFSFTLTGSPTANRTITFPDATGIMPLISGSITATHCAAWVSATQLGDAGAACGTGGGGGNVTGPASSTVDDLVGWNNTLGTLVKDEAVQVSSLALISGTPVANDCTFWVNSTHVGDAGNCIPPTTNAVQYVSTSGNDANSGTAADNAHAKLTLSAALSALPAAGGDVYVAAGSYTLSAGVTITTPINIYCTRGAIFTYTPTTGNAVTYSNNSASPAVIAGCQFVGPGSGTSTVAVQLGNGAGTFAGDITIENPAIHGFGTGIVYDTTANVQLNHIINPTIYGNGLGVSISGENESISGGAIYQNGTALKTLGSGEATISGTSFDDNTTYGIDDEATATPDLPINCYGCHFENAGLAAYTAYVNIGTVNSRVTLFGGVMQDDRTTGTQAQFVKLNATGDSLLVDGTRFATFGATITGIINLATTQQVVTASVHQLPGSTPLFTNPNNDPAILIDLESAATSSVLFPTLGVTNGGFSDLFSPTLTANRTITAPDANTVLPQPISSALDTYLTALSGTTGAFSTSQIGQCIANGGSTITANYTLGAADRGCIARISGSGITLTIPQAGSGTAPNWFGNNYYVMLNNVGSSNVAVSITTSTLSVNGGTASSSYTLPANNHVFVYSPDNTNYDGIAPGSGGGVTTFWTNGVVDTNVGTQFTTSANGISVSALPIPVGTIVSHILIDIQTLDGTGLYSVGLYGPCAPGAASCSALCTPSAQSFATTGLVSFACSVSSVPALASGQYFYVATTGNAATAKFYPIGAFDSVYLSPLAGVQSSTTSASGVLPATIAIPAASAGATNNTPAIAVTQ